MAYEDFISDDSVGLMDCYCASITNWKTLATEKFDDGQYHCAGKGFNRAMGIAATTLDATSVVILNGIISSVFKFLGDFQ